MFVAQWFLEAQVASIGIPLLSVIATACILVGSALERRRYIRWIADYELAEESRTEQEAASAQQDEETRNQRLGEAHLLLGELMQLTYVLCDTDELSEAWRELECETWDEVYRLPSPKDGYQELLLIETQALHKALSQSARDLEKSWSQDLAIEFYRDWAGCLHERYDQWCKRRQAIAELLKLQDRLEHLEQVLCRIHGARKTKWQEVMNRFPNVIETHQDLCDAAIYQRKLIELRIQRLEDARLAGISLENTGYTESVEFLEEVHEQLDGDEDVFELFTVEGIKAAAKARWRDVVEFTPETSVGFLQDSLQESNRKYLKGFTQARRALLDCGSCGQKKAVDAYRTACIHWACSQALLLVLREKIDSVEDLSDSLTLARNEYCFDLALLARTQQDLQAFAASRQTFQETFDRSRTKSLL